MRKLIPADARDLAEIRKTSFEDFWSEREFALMLSDESFFGFREEHGFILCRRALDCVDIVTFCVDPRYRREGRGKRLLREIIKSAQKDKCEIFLEVAEENHGAQNLYSSLGFEKISIRKNYYKLPDGPQDAIIMRYSISPQASQL